MNKNEIELEIVKVFRKARESGFTIVLASDEEGNSYGVVDVGNFLEGGAKEKYIVIGVVKQLEPEDVFDMSGLEELE